MVWFVLSGTGCVHPLPLSALMCATNDKKWLQPMTSCGFESALQYWLFLFRHLFFPTLPAIWSHDLVHCSDWSLCYPAARSGILQRTRRCLTSASPCYCSLKAQRGLMGLQSSMRLWFLFVWSHSSTIYVCMCCVTFNTPGWGWIFRRFIPHPCRLWGQRFMTPYTDILVRLCDLSVSVSHHHGSVQRAEPPPI